VQVRLSPIPESIMSAVCYFPDLDSAVQTAQEVIQYGIPIARIEMLNKDQMEISIKYSKLENIKASPTLFFEFHGSESSNKEAIKLVEELSKNNRGGDFKWAESLEERNKLWQARHDVYWSVKALGNNMKVYSTDVCVPISNLVECISWAEKEVKKHDLIAPMVGHVGDGNFHVQLMIDPKIKKEVDAANAFLERLAHRAIDLEGTCTGEHGVGQGKKQYLIDELGTAVDFMKLIKQELDPKGIMNPGKIL